MVKSIGEKMEDKGLSEAYGLQLCTYIVHKMSLIDVLLQVGGVGLKYLIYSSQRASLRFLRCIRK